jgi:hypothetical protein
MNQSDQSHWIMLPIGKPMVAQVFLCSINTKANTENHKEWTKGHKGFQGVELKVKNSTKSKCCFPFKML